MYFSPGNLAISLSRDMDLGLHDEDFEKLFNILSSSPDPLEESKRLSQLGKKELLKFIRDQK